MSFFGDDRRDPNNSPYDAPPGPSSLRPVLERLKHGGDSPPLVPEIDMPPPYAAQAIPARAMPARDPFALVGRMK